MPTHSLYYTFVTCWTNTLESVSVFKIIACESQIGHAYLAPKIHCMCESHYFCKNKFKFKTWSYSFEIWAGYIKFGLAVSFICAISQPLFYLNKLKAVV